MRVAAKKAKTDAAEVLTQLRIIAATHPDHAALVDIVAVESGKNTIPMRLY